jgi:hypothetical protein
MWVTPAEPPLSRTVAVLVAFEGFTSVTPVRIHAALLVRYVLISTLQSRRKPSTLPTTSAVGYLS